MECRTKERIELKPEKIPPGPADRPRRIRMGMALRLLIALPLMLCALLGLVVSLPLWLAGKLLAMLHLD